jgi:hypothetical protein
MRIFSPRWGHEDTYVLELSRASLVVNHITSKAVCTYRENLDPEWSGDSLEDILRNDSIYTPAVLPRMLERAWLAWRSNDLSDEELQIEINAVADWLNTCTRAKPSTEFWLAFF